MIFISVLHLLNQINLQFHLDHLTDAFPKWQTVSDIVCHYNTNTVKDVIMEGMKCRTVCNGCHRHGSQGSSDFEYEQSINQKSTLKYARNVYGDKHRSISEVFELKEMQSFILDLKTRGALKKLSQPISLKTLEVSVWMHFRLLLSDLLTLPSAEKQKSTNHMRNFVQKIIRELIKVLGVKCPNPDCEECFLNLRCNTRSIIHLNHKNPSNKLLKPTYMLSKNLNIDIVIKESRDGELDGTCSKCHGMVNRYQTGKAQKPSWYEGN